MQVKTRDFAFVTGETYDTIRNVYGRPGRSPRDPGSTGQIDFSSHRRFIFEDAVAWRLTRDIQATGLEWTVAASLVRREDPTYWAFNRGKDKATDLFAVWQVKDASGKIKWPAWVGSIDEISEVVVCDQQKGTVSGIRMVSIGAAIAEAKRLANAAGYAVVGREFDASDGGEN